jgi:uncharacterized protein YbbC (DUF1343 family)
MGGVAGHAGVFSTAHDISLYASALLEKLLHNTGPFPLKQSTLQLMTQPEQPGHTPNQIPAANAAEQAAERALKGASLGPSVYPEASASGLIASNKNSGALAPEGKSIPGLAPHYPAIKDQSLRGFGWDIDTAFSKPRGAIFPIGSFGHTGFTGTSLWMDPASDTYVILLANAIHPRGNPPISNLRGQVATAAAQALGLARPNSVISTSQPHPNSVILSEGAGSHPDPQSKDPDAAAPATTAETISTTRPDPLVRRLSDREENRQRKGPLAELRGGSNYFASTLTGIDVLEYAQFAALANLHHLGLLTNQTGLDALGHRTIDVLTTNHQPLTTLFSPEHGLTTSLDTEHIANSTDPATGLPIISLYGTHDADRRPTHAQLKDLDAVIIDLQDAGVRFWTYEAATSYFLEAAAREEADFHHPMEIVILDRPNLVGGVATQGPISDPGTESYVNTMPLPVRHGLTLGELAKYYVATKLSSDHPTTGYPDPLASATTGYSDPLASATIGYPEASASGLISPPKKDGGFSPRVHLTVIPMQHWSRTQYFADTGLPWVNPSPNLRSPEAAILYPALGLIETTNISVGRGTGHPFSFFGAGVQMPTKISYPEASASGLIGSEERKGVLTPWFNAEDVAAALTARHIPGVTFTPATEPIAEDANHYPFHGQTIPAVHVTVTDRTLLDTPELGIEILAVLHRLYPTQFQLAKVQRLLCNQATLDALTRGDDPRDIAATWQPSLAAFHTAVAPYLLYP